jgi:hypothetical protein
MIKQLRVVCASGRAKGVLEPKNPMVGCFAGCCARLTNGPAAEAPSPAMKARLFTR